MIVFLTVLHTIVSILLISVVLMQASQGGGLSGSLGGQAASSILGGQSAGNVLSKVTTWLAVVFITLAIVISMISSPANNSSSSIVKQASENNSIQSNTESLPPEIEESVLDLDE